MSLESLVLELEQKMAAHKGNKTAQNKFKGEEGLRRNQEALRMKETIYAWWHDVGRADDPYCGELLRRIERLRKYLQHRGVDETI